MALLGDMCFLYFSVMSLRRKVRRTSPFMPETEHII